MKLEQARLDFDNLQRKISAFNHATALIYYDGETTAPSDTAANRTHSLQILNEEIFKLKTGEETEELLNYLNERRDDLTVRERRAVDFMLKDFNRKKPIPPKEYVNYENLLTLAQDAWHTATEEDDFSILAPHLKKVFDKQREFAKVCRPEMDPYKYWLELYEEGVDVETCDKLFADIRNELTPLLHQIMEKPQVDDSSIKGNFSVEKQEGLALYLLDLIGLNMKRVGLATSEHPFTTYLGSHYDERIATRYSKKDFTFSMYTVLHEGGHVLYDMGQADNLAYTVLDGTQSMSLLESQGRFYENIVGRSLPFIEYIYPELEELFPETISRHTPEEIYRAVNKVEPGLIRMDADELTLNLHIIVRYELEKAMIAGTLDVKDLPEAWAAKYKDYLGLDVPNYVNGVLQDIHWPFGATGDFPSYALGNVMGSQMTEKMNEEINLEECIKEGNYALINLWNKEKVWKHGGLYNAREIMEKQVGVKLSSEPYIRYLRKKYSEIYNL